MVTDSFSSITTETRLSLPLNGSIFTTTRLVSTEKPTPAVSSTMEAELGPAWADSLIISVNVVPSENKDRLQIVHARIPSEANQLASNWEYSTCSIGGRNFPSVQRTVILPAAAIAYATPATGTAMPVETNSIFAGKGYILADRQVARAGMQLEPVFRVERRNYIVRSNTKTIGVDPLNGKPLWSETALYYTGEMVPVYAGTVDNLFNAVTNPYWGTQTNATRRTGTRLSCSWYSITTELLVAGTLSGDVVAVDSFESDIDYYWPPVLSAIEFMDWARRDGGSDVYPRFKFDPEGYSGPCNAVVTRTWRKTPFTGMYSEKLLPKPINYGSPFFNLNIPPSLHVAIFCKCDIGNSDPVYGVNSGSSRTFEITKRISNGTLINQSAWPSTLRANDQQEAFRGGYLRTVRIVYKPDS